MEQDHLRENLFHNKELATSYSLLTTDHCAEIGGQRGGGGVFLNHCVIKNSIKRLSIICWAVD